MALRCRAPICISTPSASASTERVLTIPMSTGVNFGYQFTPFQKLSAGYAFRYRRILPGARDLGRFRRPVQHGHARRERGIRVQPPRLPDRRDRRRRSPANPGRPGDLAGDLQSAGKTYRRHSISGAKDFFFGPFQSVHVGAAWYGGNGLDRFSMYQFGLFDEVRMHGVPSAGIRFPELALAADPTRSTSWISTGLTCSSMLRGDATQTTPTLWRTITGTGVAVTFKTPWNTMFTADVRQELDPRYLSGDGIDRVTVPPSQAVLTDT